MTLTVSELTTITSVEYLFEFINEQSDDTNDNQYCILANTSSFTGRYDTFSITDGSDVDFPIDGDYVYNVYEQAAGDGGLDPTGLNKVEHGRVVVYTISTADNEYTDSSETDKFYEES